MSYETLSGVFLAGMVVGSFLAYGIDHILNDVFNNWEESGVHPDRDVAEMPKHPLPEIKNVQ